MGDGPATSAYWSLTPAQKRYVPIKRFLDVILSALLLLLLFIPMALIAAAVWCSGPTEPVLFRQQRVGRGGAVFTMYKFRSMRHGETVTAVGRVLRTASLDELPQLWQVLAGSMSLIGPRPLIPAEENMHAMRQASGVYQLRPGLTGLAQINGRDLVSDPDKAAYDRAYLQGLSFAQDVRIFAATIGKVLRHEGVEQK